MKERHDNDKIEHHNHNEYPLLYKEAKISKSSLGIFLECRKWNILVITWALGIFLIYMPAPSALGIYIRQIPRAHVITYTYIYGYIYRLHSYKERADYLIQTQLATHKSRCA